MKTNKIKLTIIFFILFTSNSFAQEVPVGILNIPWNAGWKEVKEKMLEQKGVVFNTWLDTAFKYNKPDSIGYVMCFNYGDYLGYPVCNWNFNFIKDKLYWLRITFSTDYHDKEAAYKLMSDVSNQLTSKYGKATYIDTNRNDLTYFLNNYDWELIENKKLKDNKYEFSITLKHDEHCISLEGTSYSNEKKINLTIVNNKLQEFLVRKYLKKKKK